MTKEPPHETDDLKKSGDHFTDKPLKDKIGGNLKRIYDDVVNEAVPEDFLALLSKADTQNK